jgi:hypoxanthine-DNA glycosylase
MERIGVWFMGGFREEMLPPAKQEPPHGQSGRMTGMTDSITPVLTGLAPVLAPQTRLIVLGSFPSVASLAAQQYYAHPRNQFWPLLSSLWDIDLRALPYTERLAEVRRRGLGIWDVYAHCQRQGSLDSAIESPELNDLAGLPARLPLLRALAHNGGESARTMRLTRSLGLDVHRLPSTSPANASWSFERKLAAWREVFVLYDLV